jgi:hypothetical protein
VIKHGAFVVQTLVELWSSGCLVVVMSNHAAVYHQLICGLVVWLKLNCCQPKKQTVALLSISCQLAVQLYSSSNKTVVLMHPCSV